jgi:hypothetical protein
VGITIHSKKSCHHPFSGGKLPEASWVSPQKKKGTEVTVPSLPLTSGFLHPDVQTARGVTGCAFLYSGFESIRRVFIKLFSQSNIRLTG